MAHTPASASTSGSASLHSNYSYDVFLSHRGTEVKKTFASHLYRRLLSYGFRVFLDQPELQRGEEIEPQLKGAIETASVKVAIFSPGYAESRWCLDELVLMLKSGGTILPVFYNVKPSDLRWTDKRKDNDGGYDQGWTILRQMGRDRLYAQALRFLLSTGRVRVYAQALRFLQWIGRDSVYAGALLNQETKGGYNQGSDNNGGYAHAFRIPRQTGIDRDYSPALRIPRWTGIDRVYALALRFLQRKRTERVYERALFNHEKKGRYDQKRLADWRKALSDISHISGFELEACNGDEGELVDEVARQVQKKVRKAPLHVATHPTGLEEKLQDLERTVLLKQQQHVGGPNLVGIVGLGGVGKTTLVKFFFNRRRSNYQRSCFLPDVRDAAARRLLPSLQCKLYKDLTGRDHLMDNVDEGIATLKYHLSCCQALIVLDDVDDDDQLGVLFLPVKNVLPVGSLILITSRNKDVLRKFAGIEESSIYKMTGLDLEHSQELFCSHAFHQPYPVVEYEKLVREFLNACKGLPLSLKVIGAVLYSESLEYWEDQLNKLSQMLPTEIQSRLKISYDSLDQEEKKIFLDTACFFIGIKRDTAIRVWDGSGWKGSLGLRTLESKCLVTFDEENCIRMHDHLRDLGRHLAEEELLRCPRRLWHPNSLFPNGPTQSTVRGISLVQQRQGESFQSPSEFSNRVVDMSGLQLLRAPADYLESLLKVMRHPELLWLRCEIDISSLPPWIQRCHSNSSLASWIPIKNLRVLELLDKYREDTPSLGDKYRRDTPSLGILWNTESEAPLQLREMIITIHLLRLPKSIGHLKYLEKIELHNFKGTLPEEFFHLRSLKHLRLRAGMMSLPDSLGNFRNLQYMDLSWCKDLQTLPPSLGNLTKLQHIDLSRCEGLQTLPPSLGNLTKLQHIDLSECMGLQTLPDSFMNLIRLKHLNLTGCLHLTVSGETLGNISTLERLFFSSCSKIEVLPPQVTHQLSLEKLHLDWTNLQELPSAIGDLSNLEILNLDHGSLETLPPSLGKLTNLKQLTLRQQGKLKYLPDSVGELKQLTMLSITCSPITEVPFASVEKVGGRRLLYSSIDKCMLALTELNLNHTRITEISFGEGVCPVLQRLILDFCDHLVEVGALPTTLTELALENCLALKKITGLPGLAKLKRLNMWRCTKIEELPGLETLILLEKFMTSECENIKRIQVLAKAANPESEVLEKVIDLMKEWWW